jgi:hypothetical protein
MAQAQLNALFNGSKWTLPPALQVPPTSRPPGEWIAAGVSLHRMEGHDSSPEDPMAEAEGEAHQQGPYPLYLLISLSHGRPARRRWT